MQQAESERTFRMQPADSLEPSPSLIEFPGCQQVTVAVTFALAQRNTHKIGPSKLIVFFRSLEDLTPNKLKELFIEAYYEQVSAGGHVLCDDSEVEFSFYKSKGWSFDTITHVWLKKWIIKYLSAEEDDRMAAALSVRVSPENISASVYAKFLTAKNNQDARSISGQQLQEANPELEPLTPTAFNTWADIYNRDPTTSAVSVPLSIVHLFRGSGSLNSFDEDEELLSSQINILVQRMTTEFQDFRGRINEMIDTKAEDVLCAIPSIVRSVFRRTSSRAILTPEVGRQLDRTSEVPDPHAFFGYQNPSTTD
ncbi:hypothetical protein GEMRC1_013774 [Eukaryota sp. GEM-RC1]